MRLAIACSLASVALVACGGASTAPGASNQSASSEDVPRSDSGIGASDGGLEDASFTDSGPPDGSPLDAPTTYDGEVLTRYSAAQVDAAKTACAAPQGAPDPYETLDGLVQRVVGAWYLCRPVSDPVIAGGGSAAFLGDGQWISLRPTAGGGLDQHKGLGNEGIWAAFSLDDASVRCTGGDPDAGELRGCFLRITEDNGELTEFPVSFEQSPTRMELGGNWLVPLE
jgi:hypothetical protein